jgi:hypothetical protein
MAEAVSGRPLISETWVRPQVRPCEICGGQEIFFRVYRFYHVGMIPPMLHTDLYQHVVLTKRTKKRRLGIFQNEMLF